MMLKNLIKYNFSFFHFNLILVWLLFTSVEPFQFYAVVPYHPYKFLAFSITGLIVVRLLSKFRNLKITVIPAIIIVQFLYSIITIFIHWFFLESFYLEDSGIYINLAIQLTVILILYYFIEQFISFKSLSISFINIIAVMAVLGMMAVFFIYFFNIAPFSYTSRQENRDISNFILTFSTGHVDEVYSSVIRSAGYFDEPGTFGFYIVISLVLNKIYGYSKFIEKMLLIMGFCTLSLAFMISVFLYLVIFGMLEGRILFISFLISAVLLLSFLIYNLKEENVASKQLYELTMYRLESDSNDDKLVNGDNRSENLQYAIDAFKNQPLFGYGMNAHVNPKTKYYGKLCCNPMHPLATEGLFGAGIFFMVFLLWTLQIFYSKKNIDFILVGCWLIVLINLIQRPGFLAGPFGYFAFVLLYEATRWKNNNSVS